MTDRKLSFNELRRNSNISADFNKPNQFKEEMVDHLNISVRSNTKLGRLLDPGYCLTLEYPHIGRFRSVLAMGYWLSSPVLDDGIRTLGGDKLKQYIRKHNLLGKRIPNHSAIVAKATWIKVTSKPEVVEAIRKLPDNLTLLSYYEHGTSGLRITTNYAFTIVSVAKEIIRAIKANEEPDLDSFVTDKSCAGMDYLEGVLVKHRKH